MIIITNFVIVLSVSIKRIDCSIDGSLISPQKYIMLVLIRSTSVRHFQVHVLKICVYVFVKRKHNIHLDIQCQNTYLWTSAPSEISDQSAHMHYLIRIITGAVLIAKDANVICILGYQNCTVRILIRHCICADIMFFIQSMKTLIRLYRSAG